MAFPVIGSFKKIAACAALAFAASMPLSHSVAAPAEQTEAAPSSLKISVDHAKVLRLERDADTVIVGNPLVVDATVQDSRTIVLTGRSYGVTNLIVLDSLGEPIVDEPVVVQTSEANIVRIYRQASRQTFACSPVCERTLTIGDENLQFETTFRQIENRNTLSAPTKP